MTNLTDSAKKAIKKALRIREYDPSKSYLRVPGMLSYVERENLYRRSRKLNSRGHAVEFGAFFGASTSAILQGLKDSGFTRKLHVYDVFRSKNLSFNRLATRLATGLEHLLHNENGWLDFYGVFTHHVSDPMVVIHRDFINGMQWNGDPIELLHLDLPKDWEQARIIARNTFTSLVPEAQIIFQDYSYQWSGELIGMVGRMHKAGFLRFESLQETTLSSVLLRPINDAYIEVLDNEMSRPELILEGIDWAMQHSDFLMQHADRAVMGVARALYRFQVSPEDARHDLSRILLDIPGLSPRISAAFSDAIESDYKMPKSWE